MVLSRNSWDFYVALEHREVDDVLSHWGQYWRSRGSPLRQCESIEGTYRSPQEWHAPGPPGDRTEPDRATAMLVEALMREWAEQRPSQAKNRLALKFWYVHRSSPEYIRRRLQVKINEVQPLLYDGRQEVLNRLTAQKKTHSMITDNSTAGSNTPWMRPDGRAQVALESLDGPL